MKKAKYEELERELDHLKQELADCENPMSASALKDSIHEVQHEMFRCGVGEYDQ